MSFPQQAAGYQSEIRRSQSAIENRAIMADKPAFAQKSFGASPYHSSLYKLQGILAKANKGEMK